MRLSVMRSMATGFVNYGPLPFFCCQGSPALDISSEDGNTDWQGLIQTLDMAMPADSMYNEFTRGRELCRAQCSLDSSHGKCHD